MFNHGKIHFPSLEIKYNNIETEQIANISIISKDKYNNIIPKIEIYDKFKINYKVINMFFPKNEDNIINNAILIENISETNALQFSSENFIIKDGNLTCYIYYENETIRNSEAFVTEVIVKASLNKSEPYIEFNRGKKVERLENEAIIFANLEELFKIKIKLLNYKYKYFNGNFWILRRIIMGKTILDYNNYIIFDDKTIIEEAYIYGNDMERPIDFEKINSDDSISKIFILFTII